LKTGPILARTIRHFWPQLNCWLDDLCPDPRRQDRVVYHKRFLLWCGLALFLFKLGSRRQIDYELGGDCPAMLPNLNRIAGTSQTSIPVNKTVDDYLKQMTAPPLARLRTRMVRRLLRNKVLDDARVQGRRLVLIDVSEYLTFAQPHCQRCLVGSNGCTSWYRHPVLEAKLLGPAGVVVSIGSVFLSNADAADTPAEAGAFQRKQDCELKAFARLVPVLKDEYPQLPLCVGGDGLYACGPVLQQCQDNDWRYLLIFKEGRLPALWREFQTLLGLCPENRLERSLEGGRVRQVLRWVNDLHYVDSEGRHWTFNALQCEETKDGQTTRWAWITDLEVNATTVVKVAEAGRRRWCIENQGFNVQKNSELNLEHAYSQDEEGLQVYYYLLQIAHIILQLVEKGSLLKGLAAEAGKSVLGLFGSLKNIGRRLLESWRNEVMTEEDLAEEAAGRIQIRLDDSG
jgi:hypothetical protein